MRKRTCLKNKDSRDAVLNKQSDISHEVVPGGIHAARVRKAAATRNCTTRAYVLTRSNLITHGAQVDLVLDDIAVTRRLVIIHWRTKCFEFITLFQL